MNISTDTDRPGSEPWVGEYLQRLFPLRRSLTGNGIRQTIAALGEDLPLELLSFQSGDLVLDWTIPPEWELRRATLRAPDGTVVCDTDRSPLEVVNYSAPFRGRVSRSELEEHLFSRPDLPDAIPYVTSYYKRFWGFCLSQSVRDALPVGDYVVEVDCELFDGRLEIGEIVLRGESDREILFSTYTCHPAMVNDELAAPIALSALARRISSWPSRRFTYRFVFLPETIGAIAYLSRRGEHLKRVCDAGATLANVAADEPLRVKSSRRGDTLADRGAAILLRETGTLDRLRSFEPLGSDERQYCSQGFNLPIVAITRSVSSFPEYHSSLDTPDRASLSAVAKTVDQLEELCRIFEDNVVYRSLSPDGEPNLGRRGLYPTTGGANHRQESVVDLLWLLNLADGSRDLIDICARSGRNFRRLADMAKTCVGAGLLSRCA